MILRYSVPRYWKNDGSYSINFVSFVFWIVLVPITFTWSPYLTEWSEFRDFYVILLERMNVWRRILTVLSTKIVSSVYAVLNHFTFSWFFYSHFLLSVIYYLILDVISMLQNPLNLINRIFRVLDFCEIQLVRNVLNLCSRMMTYRLFWINVIFLRYVYKSVDQWFICDVMCIKIFYECIDF